MRSARPAVTKRFNCPCCGYRTLDEPIGSYAICMVCFWEADRDEDPWSYSGPNSMPLNQGRLYFLTHGAVSPHIAPHVRVPVPEDSPVRSAPKARISVHEFERLIAVNRASRQWLVGRRRFRRYDENVPDSERADLARDYPHLYEPWLTIFDYHDPLEIVPPDLGRSQGLTYDTQIQWLIPFLDRFTSPRLLRQGIHAELTRWFHPEVAGSEERLENLALDAWDCLVEERLGRSRPES